MTAPMHVHKPKSYISKIYDQGQACGEPIFVSRPKALKEDEGWLLVMGYDRSRDQSFLDILNAQTLELTTRIWSPHPIPLGFHGQFVK